MRSTITFATVFRFLVVVSLSGVAVYAFTESFAYQHLADWAYQIRLISSIGLPPILMVLIILIGVLLVFRGSAGKFVGVVTLFYLPSLLSYSSLNWFRFWYPEFNMVTQLGFTETLLLAMLVTMGYLTLKYVARFEKLRAESLDCGSDNEDIREVYRNEHIIAFLVILGAALVAALIAILANGLKHAIQGYIVGASLKLVIAGIVCSTIVIMCTYVFVIRSAEDRSGTKIHEYNHKEHR